MDQEQATRRFYDLVWPHRADVLRLAQFLCRNGADAEDLAQETLLKAFRKIDRLQDGSQPKAWLLAVLRNTWLDRVRAASVHPQISLSELTSEPADKGQFEARENQESLKPEELLGDFSDQQIIDSLRRLPEEIRWTLLLVDVQGLSQEEAAEVLEVPTGTVKSRAHRGRRMLRDLLLPLARERRLVRDDVNLRQEET